MILAGSSFWGSQGAVSLVNANKGTLASFDQSAPKPSCYVVLLADLKSNPSGRLLISAGAPAGPSTAAWVLTDGQSMGVGLLLTHQLTWALVDTSNVAVVGGAKDYLRCSAYL